jgi:rare lipoprotein A
LENHLKLSERYQKSSVLARAGFGGAGRIDDLIPPVSMVWNDPPAWKFIAGESCMHPVNRIGKIARIAAACLIVFFAAVLPLRAEEPSGSESSVVEKADASAVERQDGTLGKAYYYHKRYNFRKTSSGSVYDPRKMTAAHPTLPLGTRVKVINLANDRSVVVIVNDRCRRHSFEFIDLSRAAARELGFFGRGMVQVRIIPMSDEQPE